LGTDHISRLLSATPLSSAGVYWTVAVALRGQLALLLERRSRQIAWYRDDAVRFIERMDRMYQPVEAA